jgi:AcrR family transcriptional regulator
MKPEPIDTDTDTSASRRTAGQRTGGRSSRVVEDVIDATAKELARVGYAKLRVEQVAEKAGVNKTTIYRRWPTKADLVGAVLNCKAGNPPPAPGTGSLREDLLVLMRGAVAFAATDEKRMLHRIIITEMDDPDVVKIVQGLRTRYQQPWLESVKSAIERGELPPESDANIISDTIRSYVMSRVRMLEPVTDGYLRSVVDLVVTGAEHGGAVPRAGRQ